MKRFVLLVACLISVPSFANTCDLSWEELAKTRLSAEFPSIQFGTTFVRANEVCVKGNELQTVAALDVCVEYGMGDNMNCIKSEKKVLSTSRNFTRLLPTFGDELTETSDTYPLSYSIPVGRESEAGLNVYCEKAFTIPACN